jgi:hypothetical protein
LWCRKNRHTHIKIEKEGSDYGENKLGQYSLSLTPPLLEKGVYSIVLNISSDTST